MGFLKNTLLFCAFAFVVALMISTQTGVSWLIFHKTAYEGQVVDIETKQPIEGASIVAIYHTEVLGLGQTMSHVVNVREAITDAKGKFSVPSYSTITFPNSWEGRTTFIIYKPGYLSVGRLNGEDCFTGECETRELSWSAEHNKSLALLSSRKLELPKLSSSDDRLRAIPSFLYLRNRKETPHLVNLISIEKDYLNTK